MTPDDYKVGQQEYESLTSELEKICELKTEIAEEGERAERRLAALEQAFPSLLAAYYLEEKSERDIESHRKQMVSARETIAECPLALKGLERPYLQATNRRGYVLKYVIRPWEAVEGLKDKLRSAGGGREYRDQLVKDYRSAAAQIGQTPDAESFLATLGK